MIENGEKSDILKSLEQERAKYAWECIQEVKNNSKDELKGKYKSYVRDASALIQINGLGNTLAFYKSKIGPKKESLSPDKGAYSMLYKHINEWIKKKRKEINDVLEWIISENTSSMDVFNVTMEILSFLGWLKRFAEAELSEGENKNEK